jgi:hypothetical protein
VFLDEPGLELEDERCRGGRNIGGAGVFGTRRDPIFDMDDPLLAIKP